MRENSSFRLGALLLRQREYDFPEDLVAPGDIRMTVYAFLFSERSNQMNYHGGSRKP